MAIRGCCAVAEDTCAVVVADFREDQVERVNTPPVETLKSNPEKVALIGKES